MKELARKADNLLGCEDAVRVVDDTALPEKGSASIGAGPQYASVLGKQGNGQTLVSVTLVCGGVPAMVGLLLFLPNDWTADPDRM